MAVGESKEAGYDEVLKAVVDRLQQQIKGAGVANCYFSLDPDVMPSNPGTHVYVVAPVSGSFRPGAFDGGGINFLAVDSGCVVKIHCPSLIDQKRRDAQAIMSESLSIIRKASQVIVALSHTGDGPVPGDAWVPMRDDYALTSPFRPLGYSLHKSENDAVRAIELTFGFEFDWDVTRQ